MIICVSVIIGFVLIDCVLRFDLTVAKILVVGADNRGKLWDLCYCVGRSLRQANCIFRNAFFWAKWGCVRLV